MEGTANRAPPVPAAETLAEPPRRRGGAHKRKAAPNFSSIATSSASSKRLSKERNALHALPTLHNGPVTRARQSPGKLAAASASASAVQSSKPPEFEEARDAVACDSVEAEDEEMPEDPTVELEFDAVRSRGSDVHAVPIPAGWFSWNTIHPIEKHTLASFFDGKSENRTPEIFMEIRNFIMKKFHASPDTQVQLEDLSELSVGDMVARQEVMEFLDHWGLINFHPFLPSNPETNASDADGSAETSSLIEMLYQFEAVQSCPRKVRRKAESSAPKLLPSVLPEPVIVDDLLAPAGPSVEYHCNSCSADCSRKRYHCQKQADFDLCTECYNEGKFGSGMAAADFILMEPADVPGVSSGSWTDQETLLLLEALELFGENWSEIAEHVATKTKAQCMLYFIQLPIEDPFLESKDDSDDNNQEKDVIANKELSILQVPETKEVESTVDADKPVSSPTNGSERKDAGETEVSIKADANVAIDALKAAFEAVGYLPEQGGLPSFAEAGNPVMALAAFLVHFVEPGVAATSSRSSLKAISEESPGIQLATRHCFLLDGPPSDKKDTPVSEGALTCICNGDAQMEADQNHISEDGIDEGERNAASEDKEMDPPISSQDCLEKPSSAEGLGIKVSCDLSVLAEEIVPSAIKDASDSDLRIDTSAGLNLEKEDSALPIDGTKDLGGSALEKEDAALPTDTAKDPGGLTLAEEDVAAFTTVTTKESGGSTSEDKDALIMDEEMGASKLEVEKPHSLKESGDASHAADTTASVLLEGHESQQKPVAGSTVESREEAGEDAKGSPPKDEPTSCDSLETVGDHNIDSVRRAAVTALSAAAVKAMLLAKQEEDQVRQLVALVIEKQLHKLETKLALFNDMENVMMRAKEQIDRARQMLLHERAQIVAARLGLASSVPTSKIAAGYGASGFRPPVSMASQKPPLMRRQ